MPVIGFLLGNWKQLAGIAIVFGFVSAWAMFQHQAHELAQTKTALAHARQELVAERQKTDIATAALASARRLHQTSSNLDAALVVGQTEIHNAAASRETRDLFLAFARADQRLCDNAGGCAGNYRT